MPYVKNSGPAVSSGSWNDLTNRPASLLKIGQDGENKPTWDGSAWPTPVSPSSNVPMDFYTFYLKKVNVDANYTVSYVQPNGTTDSTLPTGFSVTNTTSTSFTIQHNANKLFCFGSYINTDSPISQPQIGFGYIDNYGASSGQPIATTITDDSELYALASFNKFQISGLSATSVIVIVGLITKPTES
jgi:hypothetical protein